MYSCFLIKCFIRKTKLFPIIILVYDLDHTILVTFVNIYLAILLFPPLRPTSFTSFTSFTSSPLNIRLHRQILVFVFAGLGAPALGVAGIHGILDG